ncbi:Acetyltransferase (GNAT) family protein [compost metagenome]
MLMLINLKERLNESEIQDILSYSIFPDPERIEQTLHVYKSSEELELCGLESEGEMVGVIGFRTDEADNLTLLHIAVKPEYRGAGFGRGLILELIELKKPVKIIAETDEEAVDFYRAIGFEIESLGEKYPGVERFKCVYDVEEQ